MIIETKNSIYEIQGEWIRKLGSGASTAHSIMFGEYVYPPEVGKRLMVTIGQSVLRTSLITAINE